MPRNDQANQGIQARVAYLAAASEAVRVEDNRFRIFGSLIGGSAPELGRSSSSSHSQSMHVQIAISLVAIYPWTYPQRQDALDKNAQ